MLVRLHGVRSSCLVFAAGAALTMLACAPRARMCTANSECSNVAQAACVAGRCQVERPNVKPAVSSAKRVVARPVDLAYLRRGRAAGTSPTTIGLGREGGTLLLRFEVPLAKDVEVVEAYLVLHRDARGDDDPGALDLHAETIVEPWDGRTVSWAFAPRLRDVRSPRTHVRTAGPKLVRLDVGDVVRRFRSRDEREHGIAVVSEATSTTEASFVLAGERKDTPANTLDEPSSGDAPDGPYLEIYLR